MMPGATDTPMLWGKLRGGQNPQALIDMLVEQHPIGRIGQPTDIAQAVAFLLDPANSFVTRAMLAVAGASWSIDRKRDDRVRGGFADRDAVRITAGGRRWLVPARLCENIAASGGRRPEPQEA